MRYTESDEKARLHLGFAYDYLLKCEGDPDAALRALIVAALKLREQYGDG